MTALLLVDLQNDFVTGSLAVPGAAESIPVINDLLPRYDCVVATQDWHPSDHGSFASNHPGRRPFEIIDLHGIEQTLWPDHCVQGSPGAEFVDGLRRDRIDAVVRKGTDPRVDSYSGFFDNRRAHATGLKELLRERGVKAVHLCGLATDYCVRFTALDARALGFETTMLTDACRGLTAGGVSTALAELQAAGVAVTDSDNARALTPTH